MLKRLSYVAPYTPATYAGYGNSSTSSQSRVKAAKTSFSGKQKVANPKVSQLEHKIEDLKNQLNMNPLMEPAKKNEIEAEISLAEKLLEYEPKTLDYLA